MLKIFVRLLRNYSVRWDVKIIMCNWSHFRLWKLMESLLGLFFILCIRLWRGSLAIMIWLRYIRKFSIVLEGFSFIILRLKSVFSWGNCTRKIMMNLTRMLIMLRLWSWLSSLMINFIKKKLSIVLVWLPIDPANQDRQYIIMRTFINYAIISVRLFYQSTQTMTKCRRFQHKKEERY